MDKITVATVPRKKKPFVIRETPAWLDQHQDWISDNARKLYKALRTLADVKTGRLFINSRGWIALSTVEKKAGMCDESRKKYMRELIALGAVKQGEGKQKGKLPRDYVIRCIHGRSRKVLGQAQITILPLKIPESNGVRPVQKSKVEPQHRASTTAKNKENADSEPQDCVSTTAKSTTAKAENGLLRLISSTVEDFGHQDLSKDTSSGPVEGGGSESVAVASVGAGDSPVTLEKETWEKSFVDIPRGNLPQKAPTARTLAPTPDVSPLAIEKQKLIANLKAAVYRELSDDRPNLLSARQFYQREFDALAVPFREFCKIYEDAVQDANLRFAPTESVIQNPVGTVDALRLAQLAAADPDCSEHFLTPDGCAVLVYAHGIEEIWPGEAEPVWHAF